MDMPIAKITHYYDKLAVAVVEVLGQPLKIGDKIRISGHDQEFTQTVQSLQVEHEKVSELGPDESGGLKVDKPVKVGDRIYLIS